MSHDGREPTQTRALVAPGARARSLAAAPPPRATFLMQLIACRDRVETHRAKRRLAPEEAPERYRPTVRRARPALVDLDL